MVQTTVLKVKLSCQKCKKRILKSITGLQGVDKIEIDAAKETVTVTGDADPYYIIVQARKIIKCIEVVTIGPPPKKPDDKKPTGKQPKVGPSCTTMPQSCVPSCTTMPQSCVPSCTTTTMPQSCVPSCTTMPQSCVPSCTTMPQRCVPSCTTMPQSCVPSCTTMPQSCVPSCTTMPQSCVACRLVGVIHMKEDPCNTPCSIM